MLWVAALGCIILVAFFFLQLPARWFTPGTGDFDATESQTLSQGMPATQAPADTVQQGAMIIDDPAANETRDALASLPSSPSDDAADDAASSASADSAAASASTHKGRQPRTSPRASARRGATRAVAS
ncbi:MAG: hypothetical protein L0H23_12295, partial [Luteimonas sp.]|nr:hypothetical protein [Luteimonas sp.]